MSAKEVKDSVVSVRFLREEKQRLTEIATEQHRSLSEMIRSNWRSQRFAPALGHLKRERKKIVPEVNRKLYFELGKISERLQDEELDRAALVDLEKFLVRVRRELLGLEPLPDREE
ncbi:hypothetical protein V0288_10125 [Pannus brasiliensis CCIBt3594]|uniref:Mobilization protein n=1 Tax=Pannus brasiliensis CCIBt3594 TaxID=1427578 RepID=A0AAW9QI47_9CHRO